jgi:hypothetical protein
MPPRTHQTCWVSVLPPAHVATGEVHEPRGRRTRGKGRRRPITERLDARKAVGGNKYNFYEPTYLSGGKVLMCAKGFHSATYCNGETFPIGGLFE